MKNASVGEETFLKEKCAVSHKKKGMEAETAGVRPRGTASPQCVEKGNAEQCI